MLARSPWAERKREARMNLPINSHEGISKSGLAGWPKGGMIKGGHYLTLLLCTRDRAKSIVPGVPQID